MRVWEFFSVIFSTLDRKLMKIDVSSNHLGYNPQKWSSCLLVSSLLSSPIKANRQILPLGLRSWWTLNPTIHLSFSVLFHLFSVHPIRSNFHAQPSSAPSIIGANTSNSPSTTSTTTVLPRIYMGGVTARQQISKEISAFLSLFTSPQIQLWHSC